MGKFGICRDYGLMARLHLQKTESGRLVVGAVETIAVTDMHERPRRLSAASGRQHIYVLNHLAGQYDDARRGMKGVRFSPQADGTGLYCAPGAERLPGRIGDLCRARELPTAPSLALTRRIRGACGARYARSRSLQHGYRRTALKRKSQRHRIRRLQCSAFFGFRD